MIQHTCPLRSWYDAILSPEVFDFYRPIKVQDLEQNWAEPLHEYSQFASIIKKLLAYRHQKHVQYEMTQDALENKQEQLEELEKSEREARRLDEALARGKATNGSAPAANVSPQTETTEESSEPTSPTASHLPPHPGPNPVRRRTKVPGAGLLNALSYTLHGMMDVDPETARRNGITKTRENISHVRSVSLHHPSVPNGRLSSLRTHFIWLLRISNILALLSKLIWTGSNDRRWPTSERWR